MAGLPKAMLWRRLDAAGAEHVLYSDSVGLHARGTVVCADPVPYAFRYELHTDDAWATARVEATVEGAGFVRHVRLERAAGRWRVTATEQGDLDATLIAAGHSLAGLPGMDDPLLLATAADVDLFASPLTNTLPIRRLDLLTAPAGTSRTITAAFVQVPSLQVIASEQTYTVLGEGRLRYASGSFTADLTVDAQGFVTHYPGLADRA
jgi:uncharacterized protein